MNSVELTTKMEELVEVKKDIISKAANTLSKYIISTVNTTDKNFNSYVTTIKNNIKNFSTEDQNEILMKVIVNLANNGNYSNNTVKESEKRKMKGSSDFGSFLRG